LYALYAVPMLAAAWSAARANGYDRYDIGLRWDPLPRSIVAVVALGVSGVAIGYAEYLILTPDPLVATIAPLPLVVAAVSIIFGTGITEEVIFRGVLQRASIDLLGGRAGIVYAAAVFAVLHIGHRSALDVAFVFLIGLIFGVAVWATRSLAGVIAAHSITNLCVFLVFPLLRVR
jgi:membrane protease YdiL (CAAX protease family)